MKQSRMTISELANVLGISYQKVYRKIRELFPDVLENGTVTYLTEAQVTAVKMALTTQLDSFPKMERSEKQAHTRLEKALIIQQALLYQQEIIEGLKQELTETKWLLEKRETGLEIIQRIAEAGGLMTSDREDMLSLYRREK